MNVIETSGLTKRFGRVLAVDGVDLVVPPGARFGLLGPNGSGKTTLVRMLLGLVHATSGRIEVLGSPMPRAASAVLPRVGALVESPAAWPALSGRANLRMLDAAGGLLVDAAGRRRRVEEALEQVGLGGVDRRPVRAYSLGMRQRLGIASALLRRPPLLLLDEPTNGLDPRGIGEIRELLTGLNDAGTTVVLSSHLLGEVESLCTRVGVMDAGRLVLTEDMAALRGPTGRVRVRTPDPDGVARLLGRAVDERRGDVLLVRADDPAALNAHLVGAGAVVTELVAERRTLEQVVLARTGAGADRFGHVDGGPASGVLGAVTRPVRLDRAAHRHGGRAPGGPGRGGDGPGGHGPDGGEPHPRAGSGPDGPTGRPGDTGGRVPR